MPVISFHVFLVRCQDCVVRSFKLT